MSSKTELETKVAVFDGFYGGGRQKAGDTFVAPKSAKSKWFRAADADDVIDDLGGEPHLLDGSAKDISVALSGQTDEQLNGLISAEQAGKMRKGVLALIQDEIDNRVGRVGGNDPKAKQPQETDPKTAAEPGAGDELLD